MEALDRMTLKEYPETVLNLVKKADDESAAKAVIVNARKVLQSSTLGNQKERGFWVDLYAALDSEHEQQVSLSKLAAKKWPFNQDEATSADALSALIAAALDSVAQHIGDR